MDPKSATSYWGAERAAEEDLMLDEHLSELEVEDLLGRDVDFDEQDDWRATEY
jgi:hypothetical protein